MSVLTSQLGGSIPMKDDLTNVREKNQQNTNNRIKNSLQDFMNSIDLRIIKKMEQDNLSKKNMFKHINVGEGMDIITFLVKLRRISLQKLNKNAAKIQRFWRRKSGESVIPYYSNMFFRNPAINSKAVIEKNLNDISEIDVQIDLPENLASMPQEEHHIMLWTNKTVKGSNKNKDYAAKNNEKPEKNEIF